MIILSDPEVNPKGSDTSTRTLSSISSQEHAHLWILVFHSMDRWHPVSLPRAGNSRTKKLLSV